MFDTLTLDDLYTLHTELCADIGALSQRLMHADNTPRIPVFSDEWQLLSAKQDELGETADSVYAEIARRELEAVRDA